VSADSDPHLAIGTGGFERPAFPPSAEATIPTNATTYIPTWRAGYAKAIELAHADSAMGQRAVLVCLTTQALPEDEELTCIRQSGWMLLTVDDKFQMCADDGDRQSEYAMALRVAEAQYRQGFGWPEAPAAPDPALGVAPVERNTDAAPDRSNNPEKEAYLRAM